MQPTVTTSRLPRSRGLGGDIAMVARRLPLFPVHRQMQLDAVAAARTTARQRVGWATLFLKGYALVAREMPELRSWVCGRRGRRVATSSASVATLAINRVEEGHDRLYFARIVEPESKSLAELQAAVNRFATGPADELFRRQLQLEMLPPFLRRALLRWHVRSAARKRPRRIGTFSLSTLAGLGAHNAFHPTICTTSLAYAPLEADGRCLVTLLADHRMLDGATVARALARLEEVFRDVLAAELKALPAAAPAPPATAA